MRVKSFFKGLLYVGVLCGIGAIGYVGYNKWQKGELPLTAKEKESEKIVWIGDRPVPKTVEPGAYLAALNAVFSDDLKKAADYYWRVFQGDPENEEVQRDAYFFNAILGNFDILKPVVQKMPDDYRAVFFTHYVQIGYEAQNENWNAMHATIKEKAPLPLDKIVNPLLEAWAYAGENNYAAAIKALDPIKKNKDLRGYYNYHRGLIALLFGQEFDADEAFQQLAAEELLIFSMYPEIISFYVSRGQWHQDNPFYVQWRNFFNQHPSTGEVITVEGAKPITAKRGIAEVFYNISTAMGSSKSSHEGALILSALSLYLNPDQELPKIWSAEIFEESKQSYFAAHYYGQIAKGKMASVDFKRAINLIDCNRESEAKAILLRLKNQYNDSSQLWRALASVYQKEQNWPAAVHCYTRVLELEGESNRQKAANIYFNRALVYSAQKNKEMEEKDLQHALELNPNNPMLLNHLGYQWLESGKNIDKGFELVEKAYHLRAFDPNIMDSMAFGYYRKAEYKKALPLAEKTVDKMPQSSVANAHLGDIYHALGRYREAVFQYKKALALKYDLTPELKQELLYKIAQQDKKTSY